LQEGKREAYSFQTKRGRKNRRGGKQLGVYRGEKKKKEKKKRESRFRYWFTDHFLEGREKEEGS